NLNEIPPGGVFPTKSLASAFSNTATFGTVVSPPAAPSNLAGTAVAQGANNARVTLIWTDNSNNEAGFTIQRSTSADFTANVTSTNVGANTTTFQTGNVSRKTLFYFRVQAFNAAGTSAWSNVISVLTP
ncbi:MAG: fibronectin type III domain-containing protein, partial [Syntrophobacteraceae bacterium]|nr:fibronectin type III domain-containing protein [Syntrophobacteraceae bacterium]